MKFAAAVLFLGMAAATPAAAETVHHTSVTHEGRTLSLSYEPKLETTFRQIDIGPRAFPRCMWTTRISVQRTATAGGQPIAALTREIADDAKPRRGSDMGHCSTISRKEGRTFGVSRAELQTLGADAARADTAALHTELASLGTFHSAFAR